MKYFSCQPDSHNGFGLLIGYTLTYFTVEFADQKEASNNANSSCAAPDSRAGGRALGVGGDDGGSATRVCVQSVATLPHDFGVAPQCFSMANRSLYGFDMAFVGASSGVMAVVVMRTDSVIYVPGRSLAALQKHSATTTATATVAATATAAAAEQRDHRTSPSILSCSSASAIGASLSLPLPNPVWAQERGVGTITWMRDKPFVFVGFASGYVEWYQVTVSSSSSSSSSKEEQRTLEGSAVVTKGRQCQTCVAAPSASDATKAAGVVFSEASGSCAQAQAHTNWQHGARRQRDATQQTYDNGDGGGIRVRLHRSCALPETGAFMTSDWFPANGLVVAGAERAVYVFSSEQPDCPIHRVPNVGCSFLACHPCLPVVSCLSFGRSAKTGTPPDACVLYVLEWTNPGTLCLVTRGRTLEATPRHSVYYTCSWKFSLDMQVAVCNVKEGIVHVLHLARTEESLEGTHLEGGVAEPSLSSSPPPPPVPAPAPTVTATSVTATSVTAAAAAARTSAASQRPCYMFTRERELRLPLHSLVNVEFISAATHALPEVPSAFNSSFPSSLAASAGAGFSPRKRDGVVLLEHVLAERMLHPSGVRNRLHRYSARRGSTNTATNSKHGAFSVNMASVRNDNGMHLRSGSSGGVVGAGAGAISRIVGINYAGEVGVIPVDADATVAILRPGCFAVGFCATVYVATVAPTSTPTPLPAPARAVAPAAAAAPAVAVTDGSVNCSSVSNSFGNGVGMVDMEQCMKERLAAGFGIPAAANVEALRAFRDPSPEVDLRMLFAYIAMMEKVGVVRSCGPVPSIADLLSLPNAPSTTQLMDLKLLPRNAPVVCRSSTSQNDSRRLLLLHLLGWIPSQDSSPHDVRRGMVAEYPNAEAVERAVAVEVLHNRRPRAAAILLQQKHFNPTYVAVAGLIEHHDIASSTLRDCAVEVREGFLRQLSPWLRVAFLCGGDQGEIYTDTEIPLWDRIAIAAILEYNTSRLLSLIRGIFSEECNNVKRLLLLEGIHDSTCPLMQVIVDCTGDFQLAACLFARLGACTTNAGTSLTEENALRPTANAATPCGSVPSPEVATPHATKQRATTHHWEVWANAYRTFLNNEQEFVKRTMFDLACQQLREFHVPHISGFTGHHHHHHQQQQQQQQQEQEHSKGRPYTPVSSQVKYCSSAEIAPVRLSPSSIERNLLSPPILAPVQRCCSVCSAPVYLRRQHARDIFAWCTVCLHGGHANHLQEWFVIHPKCPVDGCGCHCAEGGSVPWGRGG